MTRRKPSALDHSPAHLIIARGLAAPPMPRSSREPSYQIRTTSFEVDGSGGADQGCISTTSRSALATRMRLCFSSAACPGWSPPRWTRRPLPSADRPLLARCWRLGRGLTSCGCSQGESSVPSGALDHSQTADVRWMTTSTARTRFCCHAGRDCTAWMSWSSW